MKDLIETADLHIQKLVHLHSECVENINLLKSKSTLNNLKTNLLSDFLPYDLNKKMGMELRKGLKEYTMLLTASLEAVQNLTEGKLKKFDALVGENACEIRAVWIALIANKKLISNTSLLKSIINLQKRINDFLSPKVISILMSSGISLKELLESENLLITVSLEESFIIQSFLLTESKVTDYEKNPAFSLCLKEKSDSKKIKRFGDISSSFADNLLNKLRKSIAVASVQFVRGNADKTLDRNLITMLSSKFAILHNNHLLCTPMFWTYKCLLSVARRERIPLIIHAEFFRKDVEGYRVIDNEWLFFEPILNRSTGSLNLIHRNVREEDYNKMACVIQGAVLSNSKKPISKILWRQKMLKHPISTVILAGAADHRQYPNVEQDETIHMLQDHEYETYRSFAKSAGFSLDNPRTFFIQHVYADRVDSIFTSKMEIGSVEQVVSI